MAITRWPFEFTCWLKTQADLQCRILRRLETLTEIDTVTRNTAVKLEKILELVHARETLEVDRLDTIEAKIYRRLRLRASAQNSRARTVAATG